HLLAALAAGVTIAPLDPSSTPAELARSARNLGLTAWVTDDVSVLRAAAGMGVAAWAADWRGLHRALPRSIMTGPVDAAPAAAILMSSSGTTGEPKIIGLTERQLLHAATAIARHHELSADE